MTIKTDLITLAGLLGRIERETPSKAASEAHDKAWAFICQHAAKLDGLTDADLQEIAAAVHAGDNGVSTRSGGYKTPPPPVAPE